MTNDKSKDLAKNNRISVSAEVFGKYNAKLAFEHTIIKKSD